MNGGWEWDETLFEGAAACCAQGRLPCAPGLVPLPDEVLAADGQGRLLDAGCGPGTVATPLAGLFREVVGIDPDAGMIAEAAKPGHRRRTGRQGAPGAPHLFGARREAFETDLRRLLAGAAPAGLSSERGPSTEVFIWRQPVSGSAVG
ncbi:class I SAM-dependent methyltransferase [Streptomyces sp. NPDC001851]|uniref:class I SAM-dependent methyltransferase n=1 Tax=Streptomyces sp. NPDC001851 TaxID=3154529 RepID=UPI003332254D